MSVPVIVACHYVPRRDELPAVPPYANATFTFGYGPEDVTIAFLRAPILDDAGFRALAEKGGGEVPASVIAAVTMPRSVARALGRTLASLAVPGSPDAPAELPELASA